MLLTIPLLTASALVTVSNGPWYFCFSVYCIGDRLLIHSTALLSAQASIRHWCLCRLLGMFGVWFEWLYIAEVCGTDAHIALISPVSTLF